MTEKITVQIATKEDLSGIHAIEDAITRIKKEKIQLRLQAQTDKLKEADTKIANLKKTLAQIEAVPPHLRVKFDETGINKLKAEISTIEKQKANLKLDVEKSELELAKAEIKALDDEPIKPKIDTTEAQIGIQNLSQGFENLRQGASDLKREMGGILESAGRMEQTESFLSMNLGAEKAKQKLQEIRSVTDQLPGDDVTLQNLLSQAALKDANMGVDAMKQMGQAGADYMAAMTNYGKTATETQQDLMNYILAGNTAEVERSPVLQSHIDKLKEANTVQERSKALQEALQAEGWSGIASQDTYNNKLQTFNDLLARGKTNLGDLFLEPSKQVMEFVGGLDQATGGIVGMSVAAATMATPLFQSAQGIVQMGMGLKVLKGDASIIDGIKSKFHGLKESIGNIKQNAITAGSTIRSSLGGALSSLKNIIQTSVIPAVYSASLKFLELGRNALTAGLNALKSVAMWVAEKVAMIASTIATQGLAIAQGILNVVMAMNPVMLVVLALIALAAAIIWCYYNVDQFRQFVDQLWQTIMQVFTSIRDTIAQFTSALGLEKDSWINNLLAFLIFVGTLPIQLAIIFANMIAKALGFGDNFVQNMVKGAQDAVNGFINWISQLPGKLKEELDKMLDMAGKFAVDIGNKLSFGGLSAVTGWEGTTGEHSPGYMYEMFAGELKAMENAPKEYNIAGSMSNVGNDMVSSFNSDFGSSTGGTSGTGADSIIINVNNPIVDSRDRIREIEAELAGLLQEANLRKNI